MGEHPPVPGPSGEPSAPATSEQERLWLLHQRDPEDRAYDVPLAFRVRGRVDTAGLHRAVRAMVERHVALRTRLVPTPKDWSRRSAIPTTRGKASKPARGGVAGHRRPVLRPPFRSRRHADAAGRVGDTAGRRTPAPAPPPRRRRRLVPQPPPPRPDRRLCRGRRAAVTRPHPLDFARWQRTWHTSPAYEDRRTRLRSHHGRDGEPSPHCSRMPPRATGPPPAHLARPGPP